MARRSRSAVGRSVGHYPAASCGRVSSSTRYVSGFFSCMTHVAFVPARNAASAAAAAETQRFFLAALLLLCIEWPPTHIPLLPMEINKLPDSSCVIPSKVQSCKSPVQAHDAAAHLPSCPLIPHAYAYVASCSKYAMCTYAPLGVFSRPGRRKARLT